MDYRELLRSVRARPGSFFGEADLTYRQLVAFVTGLEFGSGGTFAAFRAFCVLRAGTGDNQRIF